jgi:hypothetical protein
MALLTVLVKELQSAVAGDFSTLTAQEQTFFALHCQVVGSPLQQYAAKIYINK